MGIPASSRNIFPSNIQGLPTWFEVRISEGGHLGRRGGVDMMVAMNPQTWNQDIAEIEPGGYLLYDSTRPMPASRFRDDINVIGAPLTEICNRTYDDARQRQLFKNIIYLGVLSALLDMDVPAIEKLIGEQFRGKDALIKPNLHALHLGRDWAKEALDCPIGLQARKPRQGRRPHLHQRQRRGGARRGLWRRDSVRLVPDHPVLVARRGVRGALLSAAPRPGDKEKRYAIIQAEDELASIGMVIGAAWNGARAFTATSGSRHLADAGIHRPRLFRRNPGGHFRHPARQPVDRHADPHAAGRHPLWPPTPRTATPSTFCCSRRTRTRSFTFAADALDLADRLQTPVFVMMDLDIGMNDWLVPPLKWDPDRNFDRGKVMDFEDLEAGKEFGRYLDVDGDGIPYRTYPGTHPTRGAFFTRGTTKDRYARYTEEGGPYVDNMQRLLRKFETAKRYVPRPIKRDAKEPTKFGAIYFGSSSLAMEEALDALEARGIHLDTLRIRAFPFHDDVFDFISNHERVFVVEQNRDKQMRTLLTTELEIDPARLVPILHYDGTPITARFIVKAIADMLSVVTLAPLRKALP